MYFSQLITKRLIRIIRYFVFVIIPISVSVGCTSSAHQFFDIHDGNVRYTDLSGRHYKVANSDPKTFKHLGGVHGKDNNYVFYAYNVIEGADPRTFEAIGKIAGRDAKRVYIAGKYCSYCDVASFRWVDGDYFADKNSVYRREVALPGVEVSSFERLNHTFAKDANNVFALHWQIPGADAPSFKLKTCGVCEVCAEDKNRCYSWSNPVPCDCKSYSGPKLYGVTEIPQGKALVLTPHFGIDLARAENHKATYLGVSGHWGIASGTNTFSLNCNGKRGSLTLKAKRGHVYRLEKRQDTTCDAEIVRPALVQGREDGPVIYIRANGIKKARSEIELQSGPQTITAVCRDVNRIKVRESSVELNMVLEAGRIYKLNAGFLPPEDKCDIRVTLVE